MCQLKPRVKLTPEGVEVESHVRGALFKWVDKVGAPGGISVGGVSAGLCASKHLEKQTLVSHVVPVWIMAWTDTRRQLVYTNVRSPLCHKGCL
jgi:S-formylglutathione hydrolase FrmB